MEWPTSGQSGCLPCCLPESSAKVADGMPSGERPTRPRLHPMEVQMLDNLGKDGITRQRLLELRIQQIERLPED
jgi:hypothetical protein